MRWVVRDLTSLGDAPPFLRIVSVTTRATASSTAVRELLRELQASASRGKHLLAPGTGSALGEERAVRS